MRVILPAGLTVRLSHADSKQMDILTMCKGITIISNNLFDIKTTLSKFVQLYLGGHLSN